MSEVTIHRTELDGVLTILPPTRHEDFRGDFVESYNEELYRAAGISHRFVQDDYSTSTQHVLRGFHGDQTKTKLISCCHGKVYLIAVNNDPTSPQFRKWKSFTLSAENRLQVLVPPKFGNAFLVMSPSAIVQYKQDGYYDRAAQFEIKWNDPAYGFWWPMRNPILSERDYA